MHLLLGRKRDVTYKLLGIGTYCGFAIHLFMEGAMFRRGKVVISESNTVYMAKPVKDIFVSIGDMHYEDKSKSSSLTFCFFSDFCLFEFRILDLF